MNNKHLFLHQLDKQDQDRLEQKETQANERRKIEKDLEQIKTDLGIYHPPDH